jgi:hypothetical protein
MVGFGVRGAEDGMMDRMRGSRVRRHISRRSSSGEEWTGGDDWRE